ncbi:hypothetical protein GCM10009738_66530 [Kitasatospora viridis]
MVIAPGVLYQYATGVLDAFGRVTVDGTLGNPDFSPKPYTYAPALGPSLSSPQWSFGSPSASAVLPGWGAKKGSPDGMAALRDVGSSDGSVLIQLIPQTTGVVLDPAWGNGKSAGDVWGVQDFAFCVKHTGSSSYTPGADRYYLAFTRRNQEARMYFGYDASVAPWDVLPSDEAAIPLSGKVNLWDGKRHDILVSQFYSSVVCLVDYKVPLIFNEPRLFYPPTTSFPRQMFFFGGSYMGVDTRGTDTLLTAWTALQPSYADLFLWHQASRTIEQPSTSTYTPTSLDSSDGRWTVTGTATASKDGVLLASGSSMFVTPNRGSGWLVTRFGAVAAAGGLVFRRQDASNYLMLTQSGQIQAVVGGTATTIATLPGSTSITAETDVVLRFNGSTLACNLSSGASLGDVANLTTGVPIGPYFPQAKGVGLLSPAGATSQFRYFYFQPDYDLPVLPTT